MVPKLLKIVIQEYRKGVQWNYKNTKINSNSLKRKKDYTFKKIGGGSNSQQEC